MRILETVRSLDMSYNSAFNGKEERDLSRLDNSGGKTQIKQSDLRNLPQPFTPRAVILSHENSDLNDLFEGEPDSDLFPLSSPNRPNILSTWLAFQDRHARETNPDSDETCTSVDVETYLMASGGLGEGDTPYDTSECVQPHESSVIDRHDPGEIDVVRPSTHQMSESVWNRSSNYKDECAHNQAYLATLRSDALREYRDTSAAHDCDAYSATGSSDSISVSNEETLSAPHDEYVKDSTLEIPPAQTCAAELTPTSFVEHGSNKPSYTQRHDELQFGFSAVESTQSALWHSRSYLPEVTSTDTQERSPSVIPRLTHGSVSHANSLADELLNEEGLKPSLEACQPKDDGLFGRNSNVSTESASSMKPGNEILETTPPFTAFGGPPESRSSSARLDDMNSSNPPGSASFLLRQFDVKPPEIRKPGVLATQGVDGNQSARSDGSSCVAPLGYPDSSFQYNSARLTPPLRSPQTSDREFAQNVFPCQPIGSKVYASDQPEVHQATEQSGLSTNPRHHTSIAEDTVTVITMASEWKDAPNIVLKDQQLHEGAVAVIQQLEPNDPSVQDSDAPDISIITNITMSSPYSPPPAVPVHSSNDSSPPSPLAGLQNAIHVAKRGSRRATATRKATVDPGNTRGRANSTSPTKRKATATRKSILAAGVQGEAAKVTKSRTTRAARSASRNSTAIVRCEISGDADIPPVPKLSNDMDLDLPELRLQPETSPEDEQVIDENPTAAIEQELKIRAVTMNTTVSTIMGIVKLQDNSRLSEHSCERPGTSTHTISLQLHVPKTREPAMPNSVATAEKAVASLNEDSPIVEVTSTEHETNLPQISATNYGPKEFTPSPRKKLSTRTATPYRVQKLILRCPRTPNPIPPAPSTTTSVLSNLASLPDFLPINAVTQLPDSPTPAPTPTPKFKLKSKPKPRRTPRKGTPPPKKRKSTRSGTSKVKDHAFVDAIPPVPPIPKTPDRTVPNKSPMSTTIEQGARLTPQNAEQEFGASQSPSSLSATLRRSPRLSGVMPGQGL